MSTDRSERGADRESSVVLVGLILRWVSFTRGELSVADSLSRPPSTTSDEKVAD
jgi:hypothetical protein